MRPTSPDAREPEPVLHGREAELAALDATLTEALSGRGRLAMVSGEAGIGKTAIATVVALRAEARGARVTWGRAWEFADAPPYFPLWPCLRGLGLPTGGEGRGTVETADPSQAFSLWEDVASALARSCAEAPVVWILEDLHAADLGTLDLLTFLTLPLRGLPALVLVTLRDPDPRLTDRARQRLARLEREGHRLELTPLGESAVAAVTEHTLGRALPDDALHRLVALTGGNPLFVVECARAFRSAGGVEGTLSSLAPSVRLLVADRIALLPEATRAALAAGAVLGREFSAASVARMSDSLPARSIDALLPALRSGLVRESKPGAFSFSHALVRDAIEETLPAAERAALHGRAERALAALGDGPDLLVERARHALASLPGGEEEQVVALVRRAVELLEREGAFDRAFELQARLLDVRDAGLLSAAAPAERLRVAKLAHLAGRFDAHRKHAEQVVSLARAAGDPLLLADAALTWGAEILPGVMDRGLLKALEDATAALGASPPRLACRLRARLATALMPSFDVSRPVALAREAIASAREIGDDAVTLEVLGTVSWTLYECLTVGERVALSTEMLQRARAAGDRTRALTATAWLAVAHVDAGDFEAFDGDTESLLTLADEVGHPRHRWRALLIASMRAAMRGHFVESDRAITEVAQLAALVDEPGLALSLASHELLRGRLLRRDGEQRQAMSRLDDAMRGVAEGALIAAVLRASCAARMEDAVTTSRELATLGSRAPLFYRDATFGALLAESLALVGPDEERRSLRQILREQPIGEITSGLIGMTYEGSVVRVIGLLDAALGDLDDARRHLGEAHALAVARRQGPWVAQIAWELTRLERGAGRVEEARAWGDQAERLARELGMVGLVESLQEHARQAAPDDRQGSDVRLERAGQVWTVARGDRRAVVRDSRGMRLLARLVERPGEELHVLSLVSDDAASPPESNAGEMLDERARREYRARLAELDAELAGAERDTDLGRTDRLRRERELLVRELSRAVGLGGQARKAASATERARVNVQRRIKDAIGRIAESDPDLGAFFDRGVSTGTFCVFKP